MNEFDDFKSKITFENKTIVGVVGLVVGFIFWGIGHPGIGIGDVLLLIFPCIFLIIPNETIKNSKVLAIISAIIIVILLLVGISDFIIVLTQYMPDSYMFPEGYVASMFLSDVLQIILAIYGLFSAFLLTVQTKQNSNSSFLINTQKNNVKSYDKYCRECGHGLFNDDKFCAGCGAKVTKDIKEDQDNEKKHCVECGRELYDDSNFCPECGVEVTNDNIGDSSQDTDEENIGDKCSECGVELDEGSIFCPECGSKVVTSDEENVE